MRRRVAVVAVVALLGGAAGAGVWLRADAAAEAREAAVQRAGAAVEASSDDVAAAVLADRRVAHRGGLVASGSAADELTLAVDAATALLTATQGAVTDEATWQALADALAAAGPLGGASPLTVRASVDRLTAAAAAVGASHDAWTSAQVAAAAAAPVPTKAPSAPAPAASRGPAPSCDTTYTGPPFFTSAPTDGGDGSNGRIPAAELTAVSWAVDPHGTPYYLRTAAAAALERLDRAFVAAFGHHLDLDLTYRDYDTQVAMRDALGTVAAVPGTSSHGTGQALDVPELPCEYGYGTPQRDWLVRHGPSYGWVAPAWARQGGSNPEYWHFEYTG